LKWVIYFHLENGTRYGLEGLELNKWGRNVSGWYNIWYSRWELAVADVVCIRNGSGSNFDAPTYNTYQYQRKRSLQMHLDLNHCQLAIAALRSERKSGWLKSWVNVSDGSESRHVHFSCTVRTEVFSTKSPWSVFFRGEMVVIKCLWNHSETFTAKIYKLGPKCRFYAYVINVLSVETA
jgi:hypothetical protein